jgi:hypothetical protein
MTMVDPFTLTLQTLNSLTIASTVGFIARQGALGVRPV